MLLNKGRFIVVEGLEGAGKSTVVAEIIHFLTDRAIPCIQTREPGGTKIGEQLRQIIKSGFEDETLEPQAELLLIYAARTQLVEHIIYPALQAGTWVICDRFELSTFAYQGGGRQLNTEMIETFSQLCLHGFKPDHTIFLEIMPESGLSRVNARGATDKIEQESCAFFSRVYHAYHERLATMQNMTMIQAALPLEKVIEQVHAVLKTLTPENVTS